jgi:hypothetical protein
MQHPEKQFCEYRNQEQDPFVKLFYDILSRYHTHDYDIAIAGMSDGLRAIIEACNERLQSQGESIALSYLINQIVFRYDDVFYIFDHNGKMQDVTQIIEKAIQMQSERTHNN